MAMRYEVVLPEEKKEKKWKMFLIFAISLLLHTGVLFLFRGQIIGALSEARLREIELMEEKLAQKKNVNPKAAKKLEQEKKKEEEKKGEKKEGDNKPAGKMDLAPKLSTTLPNPNIKIGGPKLNMDLPQDLKIQIAQTQVLPEQMTVEKIDISQINALQNMDVGIDIENLEPSMDLDAADMVIAVPSGKGASTAQILAMEAVPAVSLGGPGIEGALGGGLGFGEEGGGGGLGFGGKSINLAESGPGLAPSTDIKLSSGSETFKAVEQQLGATSAGPKSSPMELTGEVANRKILTKVKPTYPEKARREGWEGVVVLKFWVTPEGAVKDIQLLRSSGYPELDNAAKSALSQWKFAAKDVAQDEWGQLTVRFTLM